MIDKELVKSRFSKCISTYNNNAEIQKRISRRLSKLIRKTTKQNYKNIFEIGCGTGFLTNELLKFIEPNNYYLNDLVEGMKTELDKIISKKHTKNYTFLWGDAETINFPDDIDLLVSSSTFQWFNDFDTFLTKANCHLKQDGIIACSMFGVNNFKEIRTIMNKGLTYPNFSDLVNKINNKYSVISTYQEEYILYFNSPIDVLKHIKYTGVNGTNSQKWNKKDLIEFERLYTKNFMESNGKFSLTYHPIYIIARKRKNWLFEPFYVAYA